MPCCRYVGQASQEIFTGQTDTFKGVTVDTATLKCVQNKFEKILEGEITRHSQKHKHSPNNNNNSLSHLKIQNLSQNHGRSVSVKQVIIILKHRLYNSDNLSQFNFQNLLITIPSYSNSSKSNKD